MPAIITHHLFGEQCSALLPEDLLASQEDLLAFLLGNQGPDPLWARASLNVRGAASCHTLATRMHEGHVVDALLGMRAAVTHLPEADKTFGRAFVLGMAAHYLLDSTTHPLIYAQQDALVAADPSLLSSAGDVHAVLESDIDSWVLWQLRHKTVLEFPCSVALSRTARIDRTAGALVSQVGWQVFGIDVGAAEYGRAVRDYANVYRLIDPPAKLTPRALTRLERTFRPHSRLGALAHRVTCDDECPAANLARHRWTDPYSGVVSRASFADLFHDALAAWPTFARRVVEGDRARLTAMVDGINYDGKPER